MAWGDEGDEGAREAGEAGKEELITHAQYFDSFRLTSTPFDLPRLLYETLRERSAQVA